MFEVGKVEISVKLQYKFDKELKVDLNRGYEFSVMNDESESIG